MKSKLTKIKILKQKLQNMQSELRNIEGSLQKERSINQKFYSSVSPETRRTPSNNRYKSPTFWGTNPLVGYTTQPYVPQVSVQRPKTSRNVKKIPQSLKPLIARTNEDFYLSKPKLTSSVQKIQKQNNIGPTFNRRYEHSFYGTQRGTPKIQKVKTFAKTTKNPILNPQKSREVGKKVIRGGQKSPANPYTQNPRSNPLMYYNEKSPLCLHNYDDNGRNRSPDLKLALSESVQSLDRSPRSRGKKHYARYFMQTMHSQWTH